MEDKYCPLAIIAGHYPNVICPKDKCRWWVDSTSKCVVKDMAHTFKMLVKALSKE